MATKPGNKGATKKTTPKKKPQAPTITDDMISDRAYRIYLHRVQHHLPGNAQSDWHQALDELSREG